MEIIAKTKEEVLSYLEAHALGRTGGKPGEYVLMRDDQNQLIVVIAGQTFCGNGKMTIKDPSGMRVAEVKEGIVVKL